MLNRVYRVSLPNAYKLMCFDRNINGNRDVKFLGCDYLLVQRCVKLTLADFKNLKINLLYSKKTDGQEFQSVEVRKFAREFSHGLNFNECDKTFYI